jgi:hypothetical protein
MSFGRVKACAEGDYAEVGTYQGNYARIIYSHLAAGTASLLRHLRRVRKAISRGGKRATGAAFDVELFSDTSRARVKETIAGSATSLRLHLHPGVSPRLSLVSKTGHGGLFCWMPICTSRSKPGSNCSGHALCRVASFWLTPISTDSRAFEKPSTSSAIREALALRLGRTVLGRPLS